MPSERCVGARCGGGAVPEVIFRYHTSGGPVEAPLCRDCAGDWQKRFAHTVAGQTLSITAAAHETPKGEGE